MVLRVRTWSGADGCLARLPALAIITRLPASPPCAWHRWAPSPSFFSLEDSWTPSTKLYTNELRTLCLIPWFQWLLDHWSWYQDFKLYKSKMNPPSYACIGLPSWVPVSIHSAVSYLWSCQGGMVSGSKKPRARPNLTLESPSSHWALSSEEPRPPQTRGRGKLHSPGVWPAPPREQRKANGNPEKHRCGFQLGRQTLQGLLLADRPRCWAWAPGGSSILHWGVRRV